MNCSKAQNLLGIYLDGELRTRHRRAVQQHLEACEACRGELTSLSSISARLAALPACEPDEAFYRRLFQRVWNERQTARPGARYVWGAALAATAMLALFLTARPPLTPVEQPVSPAMDQQEVAAAPTAVSNPPVKGHQQQSAEQRVQSVTAIEPQKATGKPENDRQSPTPTKRIRRPHRVAAAKGTPSPTATQPAPPTPEQVAALSAALLRLTTAAEETGDALHRAVVLQAKRQAKARDVLETAFSAFVTSPVTTGKVPETHEL